MRVNPYATWAVCPISPNGIDNPCLTRGHPIPGHPTPAGLPRYTGHPIPAGLPHYTGHPIPAGLPHYNLDRARSSKKRPVTATGAASPRS
ncbi:hypothetical protein [Micromonospora chokoriensis]|uniref:hypothetical protein n=1 Tax=Micromonospora chokoriensis TaxID=356851 RepID=UPI0012FE2AD1|nr:hypothetical protein [Micromonospora chokoriensis]